MQLLSVGMLHLSVDVACRCCMSMLHVLVMLHALMCVAGCRDQRITQDVNRFCEEVSQALPKLILQPFLIAYYSYRTLIR